MQNKIGALILALAIILFSSGLMAQDNSQLDTAGKKYSYAVGVRIGQGLVQQFANQPDIDMQILMQALTAVTTKQETALSLEEATAIIEQKQQELMVAATQKAEQNKSEGQVFMDTNKASSGVSETESGLQYKVINSGDENGTNPALEDTVVVDYHGTLVDKTVFDSSYDRGEPATFPLRAVIPGWQEVLQLMRPGDKWSVVLPPELAYGDRGAGGLIGPNQVLLFDIELLEIKKSDN